MAKRMTKVGAEQAVAGIDWAALLTKLGPFAQVLIKMLIDALLAQKDPAEMKKKVAAIVGHDDCCDTLCEMLCSQRQSLIEALADNCQIECGLCHDEESA